MGPGTMLAHCEPTLKSAEVFNSLNSSKRPYQAGGAAATAPPIRVLFLIDHLGGLGGGETSLVRLVRRMPPDRVRCFLVTFNPSVSPVLRAQLDCPFYVFPLRRAFGLQAMRVARQIRCLMCAEKIDLVHTFFESANLWGGLVCKLGGGPILVTSRRDMNILRKRGKHRLAYALVNRLCDRVLSVSRRCGSCASGKSTWRRKKSSPCITGSSWSGLLRSRWIGNCASGLVSQPGIPS